MIDCFHNTKSKFFQLKNTINGVGYTPTDNNGNCAYMGNMELMNMKIFPSFVHLREYVKSVLPIAT